MPFLLAAYSTFAYGEVGQIPLGGLDNRHLAFAKPEYLHYGRKEKETTRITVWSLFVLAPTYLTSAALRGSNQVQTAWF